MYFFRFKNLSKTSLLHHPPHIEFDTFLRMHFTFASWSERDHQEDKPCVAFYISYFRQQHTLSVEREREKREREIETETET